jgi:hypothetical protein
MKPNRPTLTPPWIPVSLSTLVLLGLVVVLNQRAPAPLFSRPNNDPQVTSVTVTSIQLITKIEWQHRPLPTTTTPSGANGNWSDTLAGLDTALVVSGAVGQDLWNQDLVPVVSGATYRVTMDPLGQLSLECPSGSSDVGIQFSVPPGAHSCVLQITGLAGTPWSVRRTA